MTPKRGPIENSFKLIKHHVWVNAHAKFGSDPPRNQREKLHQLWNARTHWHTNGRTEKPSSRVANPATKNGKSNIPLLLDWNYYITFTWWMSNLVLCGRWVGWWWLVVIRINILPLLRRHHVRGIVRSDRPLLWSPLMLWLLSALLCVRPSVYMSIVGSISYKIWDAKKEYE